MISFLFWNLNHNQQAARCVGSLALTYAIDLCLLAECPDDPLPFLNALNATHRGVYRVADIIVPEKVRILTRFPPERLTHRKTLIAGDATIWALQGDQLSKVLLAVTHLPAKSGGFTAHDQQTVAEHVARAIGGVEDEEHCHDTILVGDLNMNPYEPGVTIVTGLHGLMTADLANRRDRKFRGADYRRFYNPMWGLYGDRTAGAAGTYYWDAYSPSNHHWHMFDQVLLRPSLAGRLRNIQILTGDGYHSFLGPDGTPDRTQASDHLPLLFQMEL